MNEWGSSIYTVRKLFVRRCVGRREQLASHTVGFAGCADFIYSVEKIIPSLGASIAEDLEMVTIY